VSVLIHGWGPDKFDKKKQRYKCSAVVHGAKSIVGLNGRNRKWVKQRPRKIQEDNTPAREIFKRKMGAVAWKKSNTSVLRRSTLQEKTEILRCVSCEGTHTFLLPKEEAWAPGGGTLKEKRWKRNEAMKSRPFEFYSSGGGRGSETLRG